MLLIGEDVPQGVLIRDDELILSYATRGMEPIRGFMEFVNGSIAVLQKYSNAKVIIGGRNRCAYSYGPKDKSKQWKEVAISEYEEKTDRQSKVYGADEVAITEIY